ncbi:MAG TPA: phage tail protein [Pyrinomonadaceae bacterium]|nr:phage tail protein [Pyrinomonadaceae bacterium]
MTLRDRPYVQFNFLVNFESVDTEAPEAGFQELSGLDMNDAVREHSGKNEKKDSVEKITGLNKAGHLTLKRGLVGALQLGRWLDDISCGKQGADRTVHLQPQGEDHAIAQRWKLVNARIIRHVSGPLNAKGTDVAMEELTLAYERLEME